MDNTSDLVTSFKLFANRAKSEKLTSKDLNRWAKDANVIAKRNTRNARCTSNNLDIAYCKCKTIGQNGLTIGQLDHVIWDISCAYQRDHHIADRETAYAEIVTRFSNAIPKLSGITFFSRTGGVDRMTDTTGYTGTHRQRFDSQGRGKGISGRVDIENQNGYVTNYSGENQYNRKVGLSDSRLRMTPERKVWVREIVRVKKNETVSESIFVTPSSAETRRPQITETRGPQITETRGPRITETSSASVQRRPQRLRNNTVTIRRSTAAISGDRERGVLPLDRRTYGSRTTLTNISEVDRDSAVEQRYHVIGQRGVTSRQARRRPTQTPVPNSDKMIVSNGVPNSRRPTIIPTNRSIRNVAEPINCSYARELSELEYINSQDIANRYRHTEKPSSNTSEAVTSDNALLSLEIPLKTIKNQNKMAASIPYSVSESNLLKMKYTKIEISELRIISPRLSKTSKRLV